MNREKILRAIGFNEASDFGEFCGALGVECPFKGDREGWREVFNLLNSAELDGLIEVSRTGRAIDSLQLTPEGADLIRSINDSKRPLF